MPSRRAAAFAVTLFLLACGSPASGPAVVPGGPARCVEGDRCTPEDPCHLGRITCATGVAACTGLPAIVDDGTPCGERLACRACRCAPVTGTVTEYPLPGPGRLPEAIAAADDGSLWFTEGSGGVGWLTTARAISELPVRPGAAELPGIAVDRAGNVWFTDASGGTVGRLSPSGQVTDFALPGTAAEPRGIAVDGDGTAWFADRTPGGSVPSRRSGP